VARIRTIKPTFFRHLELFEAERETGLPLRLAFAGLWTVADREGRFKWEPRAIKLDCLPYDDIDFSRVLDALTTRGFVVRYTVEGRDYAYIPSFTRHQVINNREAASDLPEPNETNILTREARVGDASATPLVQDQGEGKGREQEGKGTDIGTRGARVREPDAFEDFKKAYPKREGANPWPPARKLYLAALKAGATPDEILHGVRRLTERERKNIGTPYIPQAVKWLRNRGWEELEDAAAEGRDAIAITPQSPNWAPWRAHYAATGRSYAVSEMDRIAATCGSWTVPTALPPEASDVH
jgi:hypothetical protein